VKNALPVALGCKELPMVMSLVVESLVSSYVKLDVVFIRQDQKCAKDIFVLGLKNYYQKK
jgi:hypothetical protein